jgi:hypothetical protein
MSHKLVLVYTTTGQMPAHIIKGLLEANGIPAVLSQESAGATYGLTVGALGLVDILVTEDRRAEAEALLAEMTRGELESSNFQDSTFNDLES